MKTEKPDRESLEELMIRRNINSQTVFEKAREDIKSYFGLDLSLSQLIELKEVYVPEVMRDYKKHIICNVREPYNISFPEREAAARFIFNNFNLTPELIERSLNFAPLAYTDKQAYLYLQHQQNKNLKL